MIARAPVVLAAHARFPLSLRVRLLCSSLPSLPVSSRESLSFEARTPVRGVSRVFRDAYFDASERSSQSKVSQPSLRDTSMISARSVHIVSVYVSVTVIKIHRGTSPRYPLPVTPRSYFPRLEILIHGFSRTIDASRDNLSSLHVRCPSVIATQRWSGTPRISTLRYLHVGL